MSHPKEAGGIDPLSIDEMIIDTMKTLGITWDDLVKIHNSQRESKELTLNGVPIEIAEILLLITM